MTNKELHDKFHQMLGQQVEDVIKVGFCDAFVWSLNTNEVREVAAMANFNLNKTQSLNGALRAVYMEEEGGNFVALGGGVRNQTYILFPHTYGL